MPNVGWTLLPFVVWAVVVRGKWLWCRLFLRECAVILSGFCRAEMVVVGCGSVSVSLWLLELWRLIVGVGLVVFMWLVL